MIEDPNSIPIEEEKEPKVDFQQFLEEKQAGPEQSSQEQALEQADKTSAEVKEKSNEDGTPKSSWEIKEAEDFGVQENFEDAGRAVVTGLQNAWNNTIDLGKFFDPKFYAQAKEGEPNYEFASSWKFNGQVMPKTRWGSFIRDATDFGVGMVGVGKIGMGIKGVRGLMMAGKTVDKTGKIINLGGKANLAKRMAADAVKGGVTDIWDTSMSTQEAYTENFIKANPVLAENLFGLEDGRDLSPAQRSALNMFEGMGIGTVFGLALEGAGNLYRRFTKIPSNKLTEPAEQIADDAGNIEKTITKIEDKKYVQTTAKLEIDARKKYDADLFKSLKKSGALPKDTTIDQFRAMDSIPGDRVKFDKLPEADRYGLMEKMAKSKNIDWGDLRDYSRFNTKQGQQQLEIAADQLELDLNIGQPREGAYYSADKTEYQNMPLSSGDPDVMKAVLDQQSIRANLVTKRASNRGVMTSAQIRRMAENNGVSIEDIEKLGKGLAANEEFEGLYKGVNKKEFQDNLLFAASELQAFISPQGRITDYSVDDLFKFIKAFDNNESHRFALGDGQYLDTLTTAQITMTDAVLGQLMQEGRDLSRGGLSIGDVIDNKAPGGLLDEVFTRYKAVQNLRMQSTSIRSALMRDMGTGAQTNSKTLSEVAQQASKKAEQQANLLIDVLRKDKTGELSDSFMYFIAASNGNAMTYADMADFFAKKFYGGDLGNAKQRNKFIQEFATMGINSMLSGPKTPVRAIIGTGINTIMRPASAIVGSVAPGGDRKIKMAAMAELGAMLEAIPEAWRKAVADYKTFFDNGGNFRDLVKMNDVDEFEAIRGWYQNNGTDGQKFQFGLYRWIRSINRNPFLAYGPRLMKATDTFFGQLIYRGTKRAEAFREVYDRMLESGGSIGGEQMKTAVREAENRFNKKVWKSNGNLNDDYANFKWKEAALTGKMQPWAEKLQQSIEMMPFIKPFVGLFMRTGVNALELTTKYTPGINNVLQEVRDIYRLPAGHPDLLKYGIKTADQLAEARAVMRGREAIGTGAVALASTLYLSGNLSGNGPPDYKLRKYWESQGWQARSIKIDGKWYSYESLEPFNSFLAMVADIGDISDQMGERWAGERYALLGYAMMQNAANKSFLQGLMNFNDLLTGKGRNPAAIMANTVNNQVPWSSMRNEIGKVMSPGMRELEGGFFETIKNRNLWTEFLPGENGDLPHRYDIFTGKPLRDWDPMTRMVNAILPFNINPAGSQTQDLLMRSNVNFSQEFTRGPGNINLDEHPELISKMQYLMSQQNLEAKFTKLFNDPAIIKSILDMERDHDNGITVEPNLTVHGDRIKAILETAKAEAWVQLSTQEPAIKELEEAQQLKKLENRARRSGRTGDAGRLDAAQQILGIPK